MEEPRLVRKHQGQVKHGLDPFLWPFQEGMRDGKVGKLSLCMIEEPKNHSSPSG